MNIELNNISLAFGEKVIFSGFSHRFPSRGVVCLMGPSGRGKTTLLRLACGLIKPDSGSVTAPKRPAVMFQEDRLFPWLTAGENISLITGTQAGEYLKMVGLESEEQAYPSSLSGGMNRRIALARALAFGGDALLLDEPFKGLDEELKQKMYALIKTQGRQKPVVLVTHDQEDAQALDAEILNL